MGPTSTTYIINQFFIKYGPLTDEDLKIIEIRTERLKKESRESFLSGSEYMRKGNYIMAIKEFSKVILLNPAHEFAYFDRAQAYSSMGNHANALADYNIVIRNEPLFSYAYLLRGDTNLSLGNNLDALYDYDLAILLRPDRPEMLNAYLNRAIVKSRLDDSAGACADYSIVISKSPGNANALRGRGISKIMLGDPKDAIKDLSAAIMLDPADAKSYIVRGIALLCIGKPGKSKADLRIARILSPALIEALGIKDNLKDVDPGASALNSN